ncbi:NAD(P)-dependent dehydrogenase (short-subunit alcohol dehydrogenase family) [Nocardia transvalensis]|uniref:3-oxoacyl-[acyl-carrier-protein] reductase MabA n=1 Tax=Nocardia transvalensis TaxID=37333 RepID=A0A7W9P9C9_9NOCA|nr:SDR family oxidoreductase [Nocardia transvalensis]MBB5911921.1 NAD(P)-dependent dehydrogenase (short-subunit alcohol dehydrogenase family) [Nocardia transvalensis]
MTATLAGRIAVITGGASGIGAGIATVLAAAGARVVIADRDEAGTHAQVETLRAAGHEADALEVELGEESSIVAACALVTGRFGTPWLLVNNAGVQDRELLTEATAAEWDRVQAINARGTFLMIRETARAMIAAGGGGRIVNIASAALEGMAVAGLASYTASKGAVRALSRAAAMELAEHAITVNTVLPGGVITPGALGATGPAPSGPAAQRMPPLGFVEAGEIGHAVAFFAAPAAARITDQAITVDGGFSLT